MRKRSAPPSFVAYICLGLGYLLLLPASHVLARYSHPMDGLDEVPQPTPDVLDIPALPANPTEVQVGEVVYYYNCMPCHGDQGQGLTDEFRQIWVEDHQNCWAVGCHGGRTSDEGFPIPKSVPAVSSRPDQLMGFAQPQDLFEYLESTHPPQRPGALQDDEYWAVTALLLANNQRLASDEMVRTQVIYLPNIHPLWVVMIFLATTLLVAGLLIWQSKSIAGFGVK